MKLNSKGQAIIGSLTVSYRPIVDDVTSPVIYSASSRPAPDGQRPARRGRPSSRPHDRVLGAALVHPSLHSARSFTGTADPSAIGAKARVASTYRTSDETFRHGGSPPAQVLGVTSLLGLQNDRLMTSAMCFQRNPQTSV